MKTKTAFIDRSQIRGLIAYGCVPAAGLISAPILARALGPDGRGQLASLTEPITMANAVAAIGLPTAIVFFVSKGFDPAHLFRKSLLLVLLPGAITATALVAYAFVVGSQQGVSPSVYIAVWSLTLLTVPIQLRRAAWQGLASWRRLDCEKFLFGGMRLIGIVALSLFGIGDPFPYAIIYCAAIALASMPFWWPLPLQDRSHITGSTPGGKSVMRFSLLAAVGTIATSANSRLDQLLLPAILPPADLGHYVVAVAVAEIPLVAALLLSRNALQQASSGLSLKAIVKANSGILLALIFSVIALFVASPFVIVRVFGESFAPSSSIAQVLLIGSFANAMWLLITAVIIGRGKPTIGSIPPLIATVVTIVLYVVFWNSMSPNLAALVSAASQLAALGAGLVTVSNARWRKSSQEGQ